MDVKYLMKKEQDLPLLFLRMFAKVHIYKYRKTAFICRSQNLKNDLQIYS